METLEQLKAQRAELDKRIRAIEGDINSQEYARLEGIVLHLERGTAIPTENICHLVGKGYTPKKTSIMVANILNKHGIHWKRWKSVTGRRGYIIYGPCQQ